MKIYLSKKTEFFGKLVVCIIGFVIVLAGFTMIFVSFGNVFEEKARHNARLRATEIINDSIGTVFQNSEDKKKYVDINRNEDGKINSITMDSEAMNVLRTKIVSEIKQRSEKIEESLIYISLGSLMPYPMFQGYGRKIPLELSFDAVPKIDFEDEFEQAGINQVRHKIYLVARCEFSAISSIKTISESVSARIPVSETVIVGEVPEYYGNSMGMAVD